MEWHPGELYPRVGSILTNPCRPARRLVAFRNRRDIAERYIKEGKYAIHLHSRQREILFAVP